MIKKIKVDQEETVFVFSKTFDGTCPVPEFSQRPTIAVHFFFSTQHNMFTYHAMTVFCIVVLRSLLLPKSHRLTENIKRRERLHSVVMRGIGR